MKTQRQLYFFLFILGMASNCTTQEPWHLAFPTVGLFSKKPLYPFLPHFFSLWELAPRQGAGIKIAVIDTDGCAAHDKNTLQSTTKINHGRSIVSLIHDIAPQAATLLIKAFNNNGVSDKATLIAALKKAEQRGAQITNLSLKIADDLDLTTPLSKELEGVIARLPYIIAAAGNGGDPSLLSYVGSAVEAYPARFSSVPFDVGAFGYQDGNCFIPAFSQYEQQVGPFFTAPGVAIADRQFSGTCYLNGTSIAVPFLSGLLALVLAEFEQAFTREQILKVCYAATVRLENTQLWNTKVVLGALEMRTVLFALHVLEALRTMLPTKKSTITVATHFDQLLEALLVLLFGLPETYGVAQLQQVAPFKENFMGYLRQAELFEASWHINKKNYFIPQTLDQAIDYCVDVIISAALGHVSAAMPPQLGQRLCTILHQKCSSLFADLPPLVQQRINKKLSYTSKKDRQEA